MKEEDQKNLNYPQRQIKRAIDYLKKTRFYFFFNLEKSKERLEVKATIKI